MSTSLSAARLAPLALLVAFAPPAARAENHAEKRAELFESSFAHEAIGDTRAALKDVLAILELDPSHYLGTLRAGWLYYSRGGYAQAVDYYRAAAQLRPEAIEPLVGMMLPLMAAKRWSDAAAAGQKVLRTAPRNYLAARRLAFVYFSQGKYDKATRTYRAVLRDYPSDTEMMLGLGWTLLRQEKKAEARAQFGAVLEIRRKNANALAGLKACK